MAHKSLSNVLLSTGGLKRFKTERAWPVHTGVQLGGDVSKVIQKRRDSLISAITLTFTTVKRYSFLERGKFSFLLICLLGESLQWLHVCLRNCEHSPNICSCSPHSCPFTLMALEHVPASLLAKRVPLNLRGAKPGLNIQVKPQQPWPKTQRKL